MTTPKKAAPKKAAPSKAAAKKIAATDDPALAAQADDDAAGDDDGPQTTGWSGPPTTPEQAAAMGVEWNPTSQADTAPDVESAADVGSDPTATVPFPIGPRDVPLPDSFDKPPAVEPVETTPERPFPVMSDPIRIPPPFQA